MSKPAFIESIAVLNGKVPLLAYHQRRMDRTFEVFYGRENPFDIKALLNTEFQELQKARIVYNEHDYSLQYQQYSKRNISSLKVIEDDHVEYSFKYENRAVMDSLLSQRGECDDILIIRDGWVTDGSYFNVAFWDGNHWVTPASYLLNGVRRQYLLETGQIIQKPVALKSMEQYPKICLFNAMIDLGELVLPIESIKILS